MTEEKGLQKKKVDPGYHYDGKPMTDEDFKAIEQSLVAAGMTNFYDFDKDLSKLPIQFKRAVALHFYEIGQTPTQIALQFGVCRKTIYNWKSAPAFQKSLMPIREQFQEAFKGSVDTGMRHLFAKMMEEERLEKESSSKISWMLKNLGEVQRNLKGEPDFRIEVINSKAVESASSLIRKSDQVVDAEFQVVALEKIIEEGEQKKDD